jgi:solute carrier family 25 folate transporter 32
LLGGFISVSICNPLDIARTRLNVLVRYICIQSAPSHQNNQNKYTHFSHALKTIWKEEGLKGFYAGFNFTIQDIVQML